MKTTAEVQEGARSALLMAAGRIALQLIAMATVLLLPWVMPVDEYGLFISLVALASMGGMLVELGLSWLEMRYLAPAWRNGDITQARTIGSTTLFLRLSLDILVTSGLALWLALTPNMTLGSNELIWVTFWLFARFGTTVSSAMHLPLGFRGTHIGLELARALSHLGSAAIGYWWDGMSGTLILLAASHLLLFAYATRLLNSKLNPSLSLFSPSLIRQHKNYLTWTAGNSLLAGVQFWLPIFLVAGYLELTEGAVVGIAIQILGVLHSLGTGIRQGLMPIISQQQANNESQKSIEWSDFLTRLINVASVTALISWLILGPALLNIGLPEHYAGLYQAIALIIICFALLSSAATMDTLLNLSGHAAASTINLALLTLVTIGGTASVVALELENANWWVSGTYLIATVIFFGAIHNTLKRKTALHMPLVKNLLTLLPGIALLPLFWVPHDWALWVLIPSLSLYGLYVLLFRLLTINELRRLKKALTH